MTEPRRKRWERLLDAVGIHHPPGGGWWISLRPRFFVILGTGATVFLVSLAGVARYSESPDFCRSCHIMEPYYQAWEHSKHNTVACVECHYPPASPRTLLWKKFQALSQVVKYVTRTYSSKPFAEVDDASCLRSGCHSSRLLEGRVVSEKGILFDHRPHLTETRKGRQLRCVSCHSQVVMGKHIEVTYDTCYLCHFKGMGEGRDFKPLGGCTGCHALPSKTFEISGMKFNHKDFVTQRGLSCQNCHLDVVQGKGQVPEDRCLTCHNQPEKLARYSDIPFLHENHVTKHNVACFHCHDTMRHGINLEPGTALARLNEPPPMSSTSAAPGHPATVGFECSFCHQKTHAGQLEMYTGRAESLGLPRMPSPMFEANVDCVGCHESRKEGPGREFRGLTFKASEAACVKCHGTKFKGIWEETKKELEATTARVREKEETILKSLDDRTLKQAPGAVRSAVARARSLRSFVESSRGEHNIYLASLSLRRADAALTKAAEELKVEAADLSSLPLISGAYCATLCHQQLGVNVPPERVRAFGKDMPHKAHSEMMGCVQCHEIGAHKKAPLRRDVKEACRNCHPE